MVYEAARGLRRQCYMLLRSFRNVLGLFRDFRLWFEVFRVLPEYREWVVGVRGVQGGPWSARRRI